MKKRLSAILLTIVMLIGLCPMVMAANSANVTPSSSASAYDVRIEGTFKTGDTVTANYVPYAGADECDIIDSETIYTWYRWTNINSGASALSIIHSGVGLNTYTLTASDASNPMQPYGGKPMLFVSVQTKSEKGYGKPVFSGVYSYANTHNAAVAYPTSYILGAHIVPLNAEGTMEIGDELAVRYTFCTNNGVENASTYEWFVQDSLDSEPIVVQSGTDDTYTIGAEAYGKYIGCTVTPDNNIFNNTANQGATAMTHYGNLAQSNSASATVSNTVYSWGDYPVSKLISDGMSRYTAAMGSILYSGVNVTKEVTLDLGEIKSFDGVFFSILDLMATQTQPVANDVTISYSETGLDGTYTTLVDAVDGVNGENEYMLSATGKARYFKLSTSCTTPQSSIAEFYPFVTREVSLENDVEISCDDAFALISSSEIRVNAWGTPSSVILDNIKAASNLDETFTVSKSFVDANGNAISDSFVVTENMSGKYLRVCGKNGVSTDYEIKYTGHIATRADEVTISSANPYVFSTPTLDLTAYNTADGTANTGIYLLKTQIYVPSEVTASFGGRMGATNSGSYYNNILMLNGTNGDISTINANTLSKFSFTPNKWYDVEILIDLNSLWYTSAPAYLDLKVWIDGVEVFDTNRSTGVPMVVGKFTPWLSGIGVKYKNTSFIKVYDANTHIKQDTRAFKLLDGETEAPSLEAGKTYTLSDNHVGIYYGENYVNYFALYNVIYDGNEVVKRELADISFGNTASLTVAADVNNDDGTVTKQEIKAFYMSDTLVPNMPFGYWK